MIDAHQSRSLRVAFAGKISHRDRKRAAPRLVAVLEKSRLRGAIEPARDEQAGCIDLDRRLGKGFHSGADDDTSPGIFAPDNDADMGVAPGAFQGTGWMRNRQRMVGASCVAIANLDSRQIHVIETRKRCACRQAGRLAAQALAKSVGSQTSIPRLVSSTLRRR